MVSVWLLFAITAVDASRVETIELYDLAASALDKDFRPAIERRRGVIFSEAFLQGETSGSSMQQLAERNLPHPQFLDVEFPEEWKRKVIKDKQIGTGGFAAVYRGKVACTSAKESFVAVKVVRNSTQVVEEIQTLSELSGRSDYVASLVSSTPVVEKENLAFLMMDYFNNYDLHGLYAKHLIDETKALTFMYHTALGVSAMHGAGWIHMDLKLENVMTNCRDGSCYAAVVDLGLACREGSGVNGCSPRGTAGWASPEVLTKPPLVAVPSNDVWSLGIMLYVLVVGRGPVILYGSSDGEKISLTKRYGPESDVHLTRALADGKNRALIKLIKSMLRRDPEKRASLSDVLVTLREELSRRGQLMDILPSAQGSMYVRPACLYDNASTKDDIGDRTAVRSDCIGQLLPSKSILGLKCGACVFGGCNPCCKCDVMRHGTATKAYIRSPGCS